VETQHLSVVCWVLLSRNPTYEYSPAAGAGLLRLLVKIKIPAQTRPYINTENEHLARRLI
jgi:hypothetical protein